MGPEGSPTGNRTRIMTTLELPGTPNKTLLDPAKQLVLRIGSKADYDDWQRVTEEIGAPPAGAVEFVDRMGDEDRFLWGVFDNQFDGGFIKKGNRTEYVRLREEAEAEGREYKFIQTVPTAFGNSRNPFVGVNDVYALESNYQEAFEDLSLHMPGSRVRLISEFGPWFPWSNPDIASPADIAANYNWAASMAVEHGHIPFLNISTGPLDRDEHRQFILDTLDMIDPDLVFGITADQYSRPGKKIQRMAEMEEELLWIANLARSVNGWYGMTEMGSGGHEMLWSWWFWARHLQDMMHLYGPEFVDHYCVWSPLQGGPADTVTGLRAPYWYSIFLSLWGWVAYPERTRFVLDHLCRGLPLPAEPPRDQDRVLQKWLDESEDMPAGKKLAVPFEDVPWWKDGEFMDGRVVEPPVDPPVDPPVEPPVDDKADLRAAIHRLFVSHQLDGEQAARVDRLRNAAHEFADVLVDNGAEGREFDEAVRDLEKSLMWGVKSVALEE